VTSLTLVSLCLTTTVARDTCSPVVDKIVHPDGSKSEIGWGWNTTNVPGGVPAGTLFNLYPQWTLETDASGLFSRGSQTAQDVNGNTTSVQQYNWMPASSSLITRGSPIPVLQSIACPGGTAVPVYPMQGITTTYNYETYGQWGAWYWIPSSQILSGSLQTFLRPRIRML
jgi:hypothetical protein